MGQLSKLHFAAGESYPNKFSDRHVSYVIYLKVKIRHCICYREKLIFRSTPNKAWYLTTKFTATWNNRTNSLRRSLSAGWSHSRPFRSPEPQRPSVSAGNQVSVTQFLVWNAIRLHPLTRWRGGTGREGRRGGEERTHSFIFWLSFHFSLGQNRKSSSSVFLCSET